MSKNLAAVIAIIVIANAILIGIATFPAEHTYYVGTYDVVVLAEKTFTMEIFFALSCLAVWGFDSIVKRLFMSTDTEDA